MGILIKKARSAVRKVSFVNVGFLLGWAGLTSAPVTVGVVLGWWWGLVVVSWGIFLAGVSLWSDHRLFVRRP